MQYQQPNPPFWQRHPLTTAAVLLWGTWLLMHGSYLAVAAAAGAATLITARRYRRTRAIQRAGLRARADLEHRLALTGDPRGIYGRFPPAQAGWFADPGHGRQIRYYDGAAWTGHTASR
ncbi:MAG TPA: DUF2510 domain-containing protein [Mycobacterium sp.]